MSREIKFRLIYENKIVGYERLSECGWEWMYLEINPDKGERWTKGVIVSDAKYIRNLFTGFHDKHGKEIYKGDILLLDDGDISHHRIFFDEKSGRWMDERLEDGDSLTCYDEFGFVKECKIVGNIYQDKHLLKQ